MTNEEYVEKRQGLMDEVQALIDAEDVDESKAKMDEVAALDEKWAALSEAQANANALADNQPVFDVQRLTDVNAEAHTQKAVSDSIVSFQSDVRELDKAEAYKTDLYVTAWAKAMMNKPLNDKEQNIMHMVNEDYTHTTENTSVVIPETVAAGIWDEIADMYPYWADIAKTYVPGKYSVIKSDESSDAAWYEEPTATEDGKEVFAKIELAGCELSRAITVSWKLKDMAVSDFIPYIQRKMAEKMGDGLGYGVTKGAGVVNGEAPEPKGIVTALTEDGEQVVSYSDALTYDKLTEARGKVKSGYAPAVYANSSTIWNVLANVCDNNGRPIFMADAMSGGVYRIFGCEVKEDASFADGEVLFSDAARGYTANVNRDITVMTEEHVKARTTDYCGYAIVDGAPITLKAHALLTGE